jgi:hypothetical protein
MVMMLSAMCEYRYSECVLELISWTLGLAKDGQIVWWNSTGRQAFLEPSAWTATTGPDLKALYRGCYIAYGIHDKPSSTASALHFPLA